MLGGAVYGCDDAEGVRVREDRKIDYDPIYRLTLDQVRADKIHQILLEYDNLPDDIEIVSLVKEWNKLQRRIGATLPSCVLSNPYIPEDAQPFDDISLADAVAACRKAADANSDGLKAAMPCDCRAIGSLVRCGDCGQ